MRIPFLGMMLGMQMLHKELVVALNSHNKIAVVGTGYNSASRLGNFHLQALNLVWLQLYFSYTQKDAYWEKIITSYITKNLDQAYLV